MACSSCNRPRLIRVAGAMSRLRSIITRAVPPAMIFASSFSAPRSATASSSLAGCKSLMFGILVRLPLNPGVRALWSSAFPYFLERAQHFLRGDGQVEKLMADGPADRVADRRSRGRDRSFADAVHIGHAM